MTAFTKKIRDHFRPLPCLVCGAIETDLAHVRTRGATNCNDPRNIMPLCRWDHILQGKIGIITFYHRYKNVRDYLHKQGWKLIESVGKEQLYHPMFSKEEE